VTENEKRVNLKWGVWREGDDPEKDPPIAAFAEEDNAQIFEFAAALFDSFVVAGILFYRADPTVEDRAAFDASVKVVRAFPLCPPVPWDPPAEDDPS
jgi:hypothetical protein